MTDVGQRIIGICAEAIRAAVLRKALWDAVGIKITEQDAIDVLAVVDDVDPKRATE